MYCSATKASRNIYTKEKLLGIRDTYVAKMLGMALSIPFLSAGSSKDPEKESQVL